MAEEKSNRTRDYNIEKLGAALKARRTGKKLTQLALGRKMGVNENQISRWERGRDLISDVNLELFALNCGCRGVDILEDVLK